MILEVPDYVTRKKLRVKKKRYLLTRELNDNNLGQKVMRIFALSYPQNAHPADLVPL